MQRFTSPFHRGCLGQGLLDFRWLNHRADVERQITAALAQQAKLFMQSKRPFGSQMKGSALQDPRDSFM